MDKRQQKRFNKLLVNLLGRNPAEFLLIGDKEGWIRLSDLHKALMEERMVPFITPKGLQQYFTLYRPKEFEIRADEGLVRIRPEFASPGLFDYMTKAPPPFLFCPIRPKAFFSVERSGLGPQGRSWLPLCASREKAKILGKRFHQAPLIIKVLAKAAHDAGCVFHYAGSELYLTNQRIEPVWLEIPLAPVRKPEKGKKDTAKKQIRDKKKLSDRETRDESPVFPGSFTPSLDIIQELAKEKGKRAKRREKKKRDRFNKRKKH